MDTAALLLDNAKDAYVTGLSAQVAKKAKANVLPAAMDAAQQKKLRDTAQDFEAFFIGQMMEHMMAGIESDPMFGGGHGEQMWRSMLNQEYGKELAKSNKLGIADHVMRGMLMAQEQRDAEKHSLPPHPAASPIGEKDVGGVEASIVGATRPVRR